MSHDIIINGAPVDPLNPGVQDKPHPRRPIEKLIQDEKQWSLYVQAIAAMKETSATKMLSWFQIAGIHGWPATTPWDKVEKIGTNDIDTSEPFGYCAHGSNTFPTWHRPYLALFEQSLVNFAVEKAKGYHGADKDEWRQAAFALRAPYWDWATNAIPPAEIIESKTLTVSGPDGKLTLEPNPLLSYSYKGDLLPLALTTARSPSENNLDETNLTALKNSLQALDKVTKENYLNQRIRDAVWITLTEAKTWNLFSNHTYTPKQSAWSNSIESIHDLVHNLVAGTMGSIQLSAFDPIFWLHHVNVDRIFSLWQAMHPKVWIGKGTGTQSLHSGSDLLPFWNGESSFFNSDDIRQWERFNYTYPEFNNIPADMDRKVAIRAEARRLYYDADNNVPNKPVGAKKVVETAETAPLAQETESASLAQEAESTPPAKEADSAPPIKTARISAFGEQPPAQAPVAAPGHDQSQDTGAVPVTVRQDDPKTSRLDWLIRVRCPVGAVNQSFTILFFFGDAPVSEHDWRTADNLVGLYAAFENSAPEECANCMTSRANGAVLEGVVHLTRAIRNSNLYGKPEAEIDQYLRDNLTWRVQKIDATVVDPGTIEGLEISVMTVALEYSEKYGSWRKPTDVRPSHRGLLKDRPGGRQQS